MAKQAVWLDSTHVTALAQAVLGCAGFLDRLHRVEQHIRKNKLRATFTDQLGQNSGLDEVASLREAHQLAFYIFWNVKPHFERCVPGSMHSLWTRGC